MFHFIRLGLIFLLLFSEYSLASDYYTWSAHGRQNYAYHGFSSMQAACVGFNDRRGTNRFNSVVEVDHDREGWAYCGYSYYTKNGDVLIVEPRNSGTTLRRKGTGCPPETEYNSATGECVEPEPEQCEAGQTGSFEFLFCYSYDGGDGCSSGTQTGQPSSFCRNSCSYIPDFNPSTTDADCYSYHNGDGTVGPAVYCSVTAETNGSECSGEYSPQTPDNSCPEGTVHGQVDGKNVCVPSGSGDGGDGGDGDGTGNGGDSGDGDGSGDGGDSGTGDGNGDGSGDGGNSGGSGSSGDGNGSGSGGTGDGSGSGGTGDGEGDGEGGTGETVEGCTGDDCSFGDGRGDPFDGEVRSFSESLTAAFSGIQGSPLAQSITNIQFPTGGSCPTGSTSLDIGIGSIPIELTEHCNLWEQVAPILSAVFMALWSIFAVRVFLSA